jgi:EpsI family protein
MLAYKSWLRRAIFLGASVIVPIIANGIRAYGIVLIAYLSDNRMAVGVDHVVYGAVFAVAIQLVLISVGLRWRDRTDEGEDCHFESRSAMPDEALIPSWKIGATLVLALVVIAITPVVAKYLWQRSGAGQAWETPPVMIQEEWKSTPQPDLGWVPLLKTSGEIFARRYENAGSQVDLYWALFPGNKPMDLVGQHNRVSDTDVWSADGGASASLRVNGKQATAERYQLESASGSRAAWLCYWVGGEFTGNASRVRFLQAKARLLGRPAAAAVIVLASDSVGKQAPERVLQEFLRQARFQDRSDPAAR